LRGIRLCQNGSHTHQTLRTMFKCRNVYKSDNTLYVYVFRPFLLPSSLFHLPETCISSKAGKRPRLATAPSHSWHGGGRSNNHSIITASTGSTHGDVGSRHWSHNALSSQRPLPASLSLIVGLPWTNLSIVCRILPELRVYVLSRWVIRVINDSISTSHSLIAEAAFLRLLPSPTPTGSLVVNSLRPPRAVIGG